MGRFVFPFVGGFSSSLRLSPGRSPQHRCSGPTISPRLDSDSPHPRSPAGRASLAVARDPVTRGSPTPPHRHGPSSGCPAARRPRRVLPAGHPRVRRRIAEGDDVHRGAARIREGVPREVQAARAFDDGPAELPLRLPPAGEGGSRHAALEADAELLHAARD